jgi:hypothetical protein
VTGIFAWQQRTVRAKQRRCILSIPVRGLRTDAPRERNDGTSVSPKQGPKYVYNKICTPPRYAVHSHTAPQYRCISAGAVVRLMVETKAHPHSSCYIPSTATYSGVAKVFVTGQNVSEQLRRAGVPSASAVSRARILNYLEPRYKKTNEVPAVQ